ncbi:MAG: glycosyltransferase family 4 protein [Bradyrhizobium sp.]|uniref:glycosyltransferase family 4 protein n=1 Tax=Bradyrhizobium sp. TaxID=376 RepID=UPI0025C3B326|nr:glycosyltransferase family 4 protein [Bradyrhizobium sp.]MBI5264708.1 glycosyltransferase family 4 protein [Bradyrhizobium sp.]
MRTALNLRLMMTTDAVGGVWTYATSLAAALVEMGADVSLVTMGPSPRPDQRTMVHGRVHLVETDLALEWQDPDAADMARARAALDRLERRLRPDIVHLNSFREATFEWNAPVLVAAHSCVNSWARACNDNAWLSESRWRRYSELVAAGLSRAGGWVCASSAYRDMVEEIYHPDHRGAVIWNGLAPATARPRQKQDFILAAGRMWDKAKNLPVLAHAAKDVNWPVLVAGQNADLERREGIELLGELPRAELHGLMRRAAIFTSPALYEPFGLSVLEAAAAGCALVLSDIPSFRELWDGAALFVSPEDAAGLSAALNCLIRNEAHRSRLQDAALARSRHYSLTGMVDGYVRLYGELTRTATRRHLETGACA